jgi:hypothetical protein
METLLPELGTAFVNTVLINFKLRKFNPQRQRVFESQIFIFGFDINCADKLPWLV